MQNHHNHWLGEKHEIHFNEFLNVMFCSETKKKRKNTEFLRNVRKKNCQRISGAYTSRSEKERMKTIKKNRH